MVTMTCCGARYDSVVESMNHNCVNRITDGRPMRMMAAADLAIGTFIDDFNATGTVVSLRTDYKRSEVRIETDSILNNVSYLPLSFMVRTTP